jgi:hypothetical protein
MSIPAYLEMDDDSFASIFQVIHDPELQKRCKDRRKLRRVLKLVQTDPKLWSLLARASITKN